MRTILLITSYGERYDIGIDLIVIKLNVLTCLHDCCILNKNSYEDDELESDDHDSFSSGSEFDDASTLEVPFFITLSL